MFESIKYLSTSIMDQTDNGPKAMVTFGNKSSDYNVLDNRLQSYWNWPKTEQLKRSLALAGFVYTGQEDVVMCPFCQVEGYRWEATDNPMEDHHTWSPNCPFLRKNPKTGSPQSISGTQDTCGLYDIEIVPNSIPMNHERLGAFKSKKVRYPDKISTENRLKTFQKWPKTMKQKPVQLTEAGFFYTGTGDETICFHCGGGLKNWLETDDPWEQHALWYSDCAFVNLKKGPEFIAKVIDHRQPQPYSAGGNINTETKEHVATADTLSKICQKLSLHERETHDQTLCKICYNNKVGVMFLPCGHVVACVVCAHDLKTCVVCRKPLEASYRIFIS